MIASWLRRRRFAPWRFTEHCGLPMAAADYKKLADGLLQENMQLVHDDERGLCLIVVPMESDFYKALVAHCAAVDDNIDNLELMEWDNED